MLLSANALGDIKPSHYNLAVALELIHAASLVHDDVMDGATQRRGRPTPNSTWSNRSAVKLGDLLLTRALALVADMADRDTADLVTAAASAVCRGEILQSRNIRTSRATRAAYCEIVSLKTGSLFSAAGGAARLTGSCHATVLALSEFGRLTGLAYQIYDDCADLTGSAEALGKTLGTDLESGTMTLPIILFLEKYPESERPCVLGLLCGEGNGPPVPTRMAFAESGAISDAVDAVLGYLGEAESLLDRLPSAAGTELLREVSAHVRALFGRTRGPS